MPSWPAGSPGGLCPNLILSLSKDETFELICRFGGLFSRSPLFARGANPAEGGGLKLRSWVSAGTMARTSFDHGRVDARRNESYIFSRVCQHLAPGRDDQGMTVGLAALGVFAGLGGGKDEATGLDSPRTQQHMPMRLAGRPGEGSRHGQETRAGLGEGAMKMSEAQVVADGHAEPAPGQLRA